MIPYYRQAAMMNSLNLLRVCLPLLLFTSAHCDAMLDRYYVKPTQSSDNTSCSCPEDVWPYPCNETLDSVYSKYLSIIEGQNQASLHHIEFKIELIFLCGKHTLTSPNIATLNVSKLNYFSVKGYSADESSPVVIHDINIIIQDVSILHLENITVMDVSFAVHPATLKEKVTFFIKNCTFVRSDCLIVQSDLTIENSAIINGTNTAFNLVLCNLTLIGNVTFCGNSGERGGALGLTSSHLYISRNATVVFSHNRAEGRGGAIFVRNPTEIYKVLPYSDCFYQLLEYDEEASYNLTFIDNFASIGGSHIFGASMKSFCTAAINESVPVPSYKVILLGSIFHFEKPELSDNPIHSAIAAPPGRICICDDNGIPQCLNETKVFMSTVPYLPGESFSLSVVLAGGDFGSTAGVVQANLLSPQHSYPSCNQELQTGHEAKAEQCYQFVRTMNCTKVNYTIYSKNKHEMLSLSALKSTLIRDPTEEYQERISKSISMYNNDRVIKGSLIFTPLFINVSLNDCPPGFSLGDETLGCECYLPLKKKYKDLNCLLSNSSGFLSHPRFWIGTSSFNKEEVVMSRFCPLCDRTQSELLVNLQSNYSIDAQCAFNHVDRLCGHCKEGYSLAIGSSSCIRCYNNNKLALSIFFAAAGLLLILFITLLNLTVTQGMINGVIFYANIIWVYETIVFPQRSTGVLLFLRIFIAWLNLDFGIETCFFVGLDAFWKTLLQYIFPIYIWAIVLIIILGAKYSTRLTKLFGSRTVSVLSTLALLSYMKLLRNAIVSLEYARLDYYTSEGKVRTTVVWAVDGTLDYFRIPHAFLFIIALIILCLCLPYILLLLLGRWLREIPYLTRFHPIFDSYFASFKDRHHYWPGVLLVARAFLYVIRITLIDREATFVLLITTVALLSYMSIVRPQRSLAVFVLHSAFLVNLITLSGAVLFVDNTTANYKGVQSRKMFYITLVSISVAIVKFCVIIVSSVIRNVPYSEFCSTYHSYRLKYRKSKFIKRRRKTVKEWAPTAVSYTTLRDSILEEEPTLM